MHGLHLEMLMAAALLKKLYLNMWKGPSPIQVKKKSWILWFKKKFIHLIIILSIQFEIRVSYEVDFCPEWKKILDLVSIK